MKALQRGHSKITVSEERVMTYNQAIKELEDKGLEDAAKALKEWSSEENTKQGWDGHTKSRKFPKEGREALWGL